MAFAPGDAAGVAADAGSDADVGDGCGVCVGMGVAVGIGVAVGAGVCVGIGVAVGTGAGVGTHAAKSRQSGASRMRGGSGGKGIRMQGIVVDEGAARQWWRACFHGGLSAAPPYNKGIWQDWDADFWGKGSQTTFGDGKQGGFGGLGRVGNHDERAQLREKFFVI